MKEKLMKIIFPFERDVAVASALRLVCVKAYM